MMRGDEGETSMPIPIALHGIPSSIKRRVNQGQYGDDSLPSEYGISGVFERNSRMSIAASASDTYNMQGIVPEEFEGAAYY
jgi:hypothetical protein